MEEITQHKKEQIQPANASTQEPNVVPTEEPTDEQPLLPLDESAERIQNGMVNWRIHLAFVRAGVGIIGGIILPLIFVVHQSLAMFSNWWLASWSEAESKSRLEFNLCSNTSTLSSRNTTYMESATDWYQRRNSGFYIYCGRSFSNSPHTLILMPHKNEAKSVRVHM